MFTSWEDLPFVPFGGGILLLAVQARFAEKIVVECVDLDINMPS